MIFPRFWTFSLVIFVIFWLNTRDFQEKSFGNTVFSRTPTALCSVMSQPSRSPMAYEASLLCSACSAFFLDFLENYSIQFNIQGRAIRPHRFIHRPRFNEKELPNFVLLARTNRPRCGHGSGRQWMEQSIFSMMTMKET